MSKTPIIISEAVWTVKWISYLHHTHFYTFFLMREFTREFSQRACALNSSDSSERLWLVIAFISSTESSVIGYNEQSCINASVSGSAPASEHRFEFSSWWFDALDILNHERYNVIVSNITNIIRLFFCLLEAALKIHLAQKSEGAHAPLNLNGHDASVHWTFQLIKRLFTPCPNYTRCDAATHEKTYIFQC